MTRCEAQDAQLQQVQQVARREAKLQAPGFTKYSPALQASQLEERELIPFFSY